MTWLSWRQLRAQAAVVGVVVAVLAIVAVVTGISLSDHYAGCRAAHDCGSLPLSSTDDRLRVAFNAILLVVPGLVGLFWGAPLIARELESGTHRLGWTQSVTRMRWLAIRLATFGTAAVAVTGLLSLMVTWWSSPLDAATGGWFDVSTFGLRGIVPLGYAAFAFALGATIGTLTRRTLPAMAITLVAYVATRLAFTSWIRPRLMAPLHATLPLTAASPTGIDVGPNGPQVVLQSANIPNAWVYSTSLVAKPGHGPTTHFLTRACPDALPPMPNGLPGVGHGVARVAAPDQGAFQACMVKVDATFNQAVTYQPSSRFWAFQGLETAIFVALALAVCAGCLWWVRHRLA